MAKTKRKARTFQCCKCGHDDVNVSHRAKGDRLDQCMGDPFEEARHELLRCYCRRCEFRWNDEVSNG